MGQQIDRHELQALLAAGTPLTLVEALGPMYYADAHLPGAVNIPHADVYLLAPVLLPDKGSLVVVYSSGPGCGNAAVVTRALRRLGYTAVREYSGGKQDWIEAGLRVERS